MAVSRLHQRTEQSAWALRHGDALVELLRGTLAVGFVDLKASLHPRCLRRSGINNLVANLVRSLAFVTLSETHTGAPRLVLYILITASDKLQAGDYRSTSVL
jgi:hypothetical protein